MLNLKKFISCILTSILCMLSLAGCGEDSSPNANEANEDSSPNRVALIMQGPISDMAWNAAAYKGLTEIEKLGAEISYQENISISSVSDIMSAYASDGYDLVFLSTNGYEDNIMETAPNYPDTQFVLINGSETTDNVCAIQIADEDQGFMMGVISAIASKNGNIGFVGGEDIPPIVNGQKGFEQGARFISDNINIQSVLTGSFFNLSSAKEEATNQIKNGADVVSPICDQAATGVIEAAEENGSMSICSGYEQKSISQNGGLIAVIKDTSVAYVSAYNKFMSGDLGSDVVKMGAKDGVIYLSEWFDASSFLTSDQKQMVEDAFQMLKSGEIEIDLA